jgi:hypothetical protein
MNDKSHLPTVEKMWRREIETATTCRHLAEREVPIILFLLTICLPALLASQASSSPVCNSPCRQ